MTASERHTSAPASRQPATMYQRRDERIGPVAAPVFGSKVWIMMHPRAKPRGGAPPCTTMAPAGSALMPTHALDARATRSVDIFANGVAEISADPAADQIRRRNALAIGAEASAPTPPPSTSTAKARSPRYPMNQACDGGLRPEPYSAVPVLP